MFNRYKIIKEDQEEILYLYIDSDYEFSWGLKSKQKNKAKIKHNVIDYIKKKKINFDGSTIFVIVNGLVFTTLLINNLPLKSDLQKPMLLNNQNAIVEIIDINKTPEFAKIADNQELAINENQELETTPEVASPKPSANQKTVTKNQSSSNETVKKPGPTPNENQEVKPDTSKETTTVSNDIMINLIRSSTGKTESIALEDYVIGVVAAEMPASFSVEALKAQSLLARTYALKRVEAKLSLTDTVANQAYKDTKQLKSLWGSDYDKYYNKIKDAVISTKGEVITYNGSYIEAVYHSTSNGKTSDAADVWGNSFAYLKSVDSHWDLSASTYLRSESKGFDVINYLLGVDISAESITEVMSTTSNGSVKEINIAGTTFSGKYIRETLGLRSTDFDISLADGKVTFTTRGYGHGVGMSQYGANGMAKEGYGYKSIINHYYSGVAINKIKALG